MNAPEIHTRLQDLRAERALASVEGRASASAYLTELDAEIELVNQAYVVAAVTEIATLRGQLSGPQRG